MEFPLKSDFFAQVRLSNDEKAKYLRTADASVRALRRGLDENDWKKVSDKEGVTFSKAHSVQERGASAVAGATTACLAVCATIYTSGTISEVLEAIASPVTEDYRKAMKFMYKSRFIDGMGLHTIIPNGAQNAQAFTTIKWAAFDDGKALNSPKFPLGSDYCFLEHSGIQKEDDSDEIFGFSVQESILREREVSSFAGYGLRRGEFHRTGIIILPTDRRNIVQVSSILQMNLLGSDSSANKAALERLMLKRVASVGRIDLLLERRRLSKMQFVNRDEWVADEDRKFCAVCVKPFSIRRRHHCRNCGEVVCSACAPPREVDVAGHGSVLIRICTACVVQARSEPQQLQSGNQDVFVYHIRSTLTSRTSTNSSNLSGEEGCTQRPHSNSSDSNFSIASEYQQSADGILYHIDDARRSEDEGGYYDGRGSAVSSSSSRYSFSDYNTFDDRFGSVAMKRLAPTTPLPARHNISSNNNSNNNYGKSYNSSSRSKQILYETHKERYQPKKVAYHPERSVYHPEKVMTHLLTNQEEHAATDKRVSMDSLPDFEECLRGITADISRATNTRYSDLQPADSFCSDLTSFSSDLLMASSRSIETPPPPSMSMPRSMSRVSQRTASVSSSRSTVDVDIDMFTSDSFSLICPDSLQRQRQSSIKQDAGENHRTRISSMSTYSNNTAFEGDEANGVQSQEDIEMLRLQVEGLHKSLEDATSKLNFYQSRSFTRQRPLSVESEGRGGQPELSATLPRRQSRGSVQKSSRSDPVVVKRQESYNALVSELHEIMGLPAFSP